MAEIEHPWKPILTLFSSSSFAARPVINVEQGRPSVTKDVRHVVTARRTTSSVSTKRSLLTSQSSFHPVATQTDRNDRQEKATQLLLDKLQQLDDRLTQLQSVQMEQGAQINRILSNQAPSPAHDHLQSIPSQKPSVMSESSVEPPPNPTIMEMGGEPEPKDDNVALLAGPKLEAADKCKDTAIKDEDDGELSIPVEHTTAAHKLLLWPSIQRLLGPQTFDEDYVMQLEEERGLIRVYGRGEGDDRSDYPGSSSASSASPAREEDYPQGASPNVPWGTGLPSTTSTHRPRECVGGLDEFGQLNTDPDTVRRHHKSYLQHIHILHPFLDENGLEKKIERFIRIYSPQRRPPYMPGSTGDAPRGAKRKRSAETLHGVGFDMQSSPVSNPERAAAPPRRIEKSIDNAIILLVLALGCICEWRDKPLPGPVKDYPPEYQPPSVPHNVGLSPAVSESALHSPGALYSPTNQTFPSPTGGDTRRSMAGRSLTGAGWHPEGSEFSHPKNMDVIPGLAYYAYATDILGNLQGGNSLAHVQAALLAGLYAGQLAHPFQSHGWIFQASRACQVLVRP